MLPTRGAGAKRGGTPRNVERARKGTYLPGRRSGNERWAGRAPAAAEGCERRAPPEYAAAPGGAAPRLGWRAGSRSWRVGALPRNRRQSPGVGVAPGEREAGGQRCGRGSSRAGGALAQFGVAGTRSTPPLPGPRLSSPEVTRFRSKTFGWRH